MKLMIDGVFFQSAYTGVARIWSSVLPRLARYPDLEIVMLDRGHCPVIEGIERVEFPSYTVHANTAADSFLIDKFCKEFGADVFTSTSYTTPVSVPSVLVVYDMTAEVLGFDLNQRPWQEKQIAISFASYFVCMSETTRSDLKRFYPSIGDDQVVVLNCGVEQERFHPQDRAKVEQFKKRFRISKPYYVAVGFREQYRGYKNGSLLFAAARDIRNFEFEVICVGGEPEIQQGMVDDLPPNGSARRIELADSDLACAYAGAEALVYPSFYEGFGMPVIEAMACGCPVITTKAGALSEVAGDAAVFVSGRDSEELRHAMISIRDPVQRNALTAKGLQRATLYRWDATARGLHGLLRKAMEERNSLPSLKFLEEWKRLRSIQANVDVDV